MPVAAADCIETICTGSTSEGDCQGSDLYFNERNDVSAIVYAPDGSAVVVSASTACYGSASWWQTQDQWWYQEYNYTSIDITAGYQGSPLGNYYVYGSWYDGTYNYTHVNRGTTYESGDQYACDTYVAVYLGSTMGQTNQGCPAGPPPSVRPLL